MTTELAVTSEHMENPSIFHAGDIQDRVIVISKVVLVEKASKSRWVVSVTEGVHNGASFGVRLDGAPDTLYFHYKSLEDAISARNRLLSRIEAYYAATGNINDEFGF